jgi:hypothetical protein
MARKSIIITATAGAGSLLAGLGAPKVIDHLPPWVSPVLLGLGVLLLLGAAGLRWLRFGAGGDDHGGITQATRGHQSPAIGTVHGDVIIGPPHPPERNERRSPYGSTQPKPSPPPREPRKVPEMPIWQAVDHIRAVIGDNDVSNCFPATLIALRQAALNEEIEIWGRKENPPQTMKQESWRPVWTRIPADYWEEFNFTTFVTTNEYESEHTWNRDVPGFGRGNRYRDLKVQRTDIEKVWPRHNPSAADEAKAQRRRELIAECRKIIADFVEGGDDREYLDRQPAFMQIRKYLSDGFLRNFNSSATLVEVRGRQVKAGLLPSFSRELDRLETEWGLDL